jgi:flotillin
MQEGLILLGFAVCVCLGAGFGSLLLYASRYRKVGPNEVLVISGRRRKHLLPSGEQVDVGYRICKGGGAFVWPIVEKYDTLSLELLTLGVGTKDEVYTVQGVPVLVDGVAQVKVRGDDVSIGTAAEQFLSKGQEEVARVATQTLEGHLRAILGTMTVEDIYKNRDAFSNKVQEVAASDLANMGLQIVSFTLKDIRDHHGYLEALGKPRTALVLRDAEIARAEAKRDADIAKAEASRDATIKGANARQAGETNRFSAETRIAESARDYEMKRADYNSAVNEKRADADLAYELAKHKKSQLVTKEEVRVEVVAKQQQVQVQEQEILRREKELVATVHKPAEATVFRVQREADAERYRLEAEAAGRAEAEKLRGQADASVIQAKGAGEGEAVKALGLGEAAAIEAKGLAEAEAIKAKGLAEAEAMAEKAESWKQYNQAALVQMVVEVLPKMAEAVSAPLSKTDRITIVGGSGSGGAGASKLTRDVTDIVAQVPPVVESLTGLDLSEMVRNVAGIIPGGGDDDAADEETADEA